MFRFWIWFICQKPFYISQFCFFFFFDNWHRSIFQRTCTMTWKCGKHVHNFNRLRFNKKRKCIVINLRIKVQININLKSINYFININTPFLRVLSFYIWSQANLIVQDNQNTVHVRSESKMLDFKFVNDAEKWP